MAHFVEIGLINSKPLDVFCKNKQEAFEFLRTIRQSILTNDVYLSIQNGEEEENLYIVCKHVTYFKYCQKDSAYDHVE